MLAASYRPDFDLVLAIWVSLLHVIGMVAGLISEGILRMVLAAPRTEKDPGRGGVWDEELDGPA